MTQNRKDLTERDHELRRREWLAIYLPLTVGVLLFLALLATISILGFREANLGGDPASAWGDTAAVIVIVEVAAISLLPLATLVALCALVIWLIGRAQPILRRGQEITGEVSRRVDGAADKLVAVTTKPYLLSARLRVTRQLFRR